LEKKKKIDPLSTFGDRTTISRMYVSYPSHSTDCVILAAVYFWRGGGGGGGGGEVRFTEPFYLKHSWRIDTQLEIEDSLPYFVEFRK